MKSIKWLETYNWHDSIIENIEYVFDERKVLISLELCRWKQADYEKSDPEMQKGILTFINVSSLQMEPPEFLINSNEILEMRVQHETKSIEIVLTGKDDVGKVCMIAESVCWEQC